MNDAYKQRVKWWEKKQWKEKRFEWNRESWVLLAISRAITQIKVRLLMIIYLDSLSLGLQLIPHKQN